MQTQAYFDNIQEQILIHLHGATTSLQIAVAWLTDKTIFKKLCAKAADGVKVELILIHDHINNEMTSFSHKELVEEGGFVYFIEPTIDGAIMHHKFCVIDTCTVITGSYNWSKKAQQNDENIIITWDACELGAQFQKEFASIKERVFIEQFSLDNIDLPKVLKRLEVIKSFVILEERDEIVNQVKKLKAQPLTAELITIIEHFERARYSEAIQLIEDFTTQHSRILVYEDTCVFALQLEVQSLEIQLTALENEKVETEKLIQDFSIMHTKELGELVLHLLLLRKLNAKTEAEKVEAELDEKEYKESYHDNKNKKIPELSEEEKKNLKSIYREASLLCHPDKFQNEPEKQKIAEELFKNLAEAYRNNDSKTVQQILTNLKQGILELDPAMQPNKKQALQVQMEQLKQKFADMLHYMNHLKTTETFVTATKNTNWGNYFSEAKTKLKKEIEILTNNASHIKL